MQETYILVPCVDGDAADLQCAGNSSTKRSQEPFYPFLWRSIVLDREYFDAGRKRCGFPVEATLDVAIALTSARREPRCKNVARRRDFKHDEFAVLLGELFDRTARYISEDMPTFGEFLQHGGWDTVSQPMCTPMSEETSCFYAVFEFGDVHRFVRFTAGVFRPGYRSSRKNICVVASDSLPRAVKQRVLARAARSNHKEESAFHRLSRFVSLIHDVIQTDVDRRRGLGNLAS